MNIRSARGNVPVRVRGSIVTVEVEKTSIRPIVAITARHNHTNAQRAEKRTLPIDTKSLSWYE